MLELKNVAVSLSVNGKKLIENFSFALNDGDKAVIIGEEGDGKSTLLKLIYDENLISGYCVYSGKIIKKGSCAYLPQTLDEKYGDMTAAEFLSLKDAVKHAKIFASLGLPLSLAESTQKIKTMSGGEKIKLELLSLLCAEPDMLLLDEPTNDIDIDALQQMESFIRSTPLPVLFVSHDETLIENTANVIIHIEQLIRKTVARVTVSRMRYSDYIASRSDLFERQMRIAKKQRAEHDAATERWRRIYERVNHELNSVSRQNPSGGRLLKKKMKSVKAQEKRLDREGEAMLDLPEAEEAIITKFDESITIPRSKTIIKLSIPTLECGGKILSRDIKLFVAGPAHIGITGRNGAGKSTLLKAIWDELKDRSDISAAYMPQDYSERLDYSLTAVEFLAANYSKEDVTRARTFMGAMKFTHEEMTCQIGRLSGGQKAKLLFLDMVLRGANVLLLDEPTRNFSPLSNPAIRAAISDFGGAVIAISHDRLYLNEACDRVYELSEAGLTEVQRERGNEGNGGNEGNAAF